MTLNMTGVRKYYTYMFLLNSIQKGAQYHAFILVEVRSDKITIEVGVVYIMPSIVSHTDTSGDRKL